MSDRRATWRPSDPHLDLMDDARHAEAVTERTRRRMLSGADDQDATFAASLRAVAEAGAVVMLETTVGRTVRGRVDAVTPTHLVVGDGVATSYVRIDRVTAVRGVAGGTAPRATAEDTRRADAAPLLDLLTELAHDRAELEVHLDGGAVVRGTVRRAGIDVLTLRSPTSGDTVLVQLGLAAVITHRAGTP